MASLRIGGYVLWPFGRTTVERPGVGVPSLVGNVIWVIFAGWRLALGHLITSIPLFPSIIGIPFGWANLKLIPISLMPLGRGIVASDREFAGW
ncbi:YccF domain-containing protein [Streptomyces sp. 7N604]|uniref:YccF domain-containing protein n=1 Tax=Streptomyces sp. 7N604 TaxID=3457415 RepID=UPI003FCFBC25